MEIKTKVKKTKTIKIIVSDLPSKKIDELCLETMEHISKDCADDVFDIITEKYFDVVINNGYWLINQPIVQQMAQILDMNDFSHEHLQEICEFIRTRFPAQADDMGLGYLNQSKEKVVNL